jgi:GT2 family glycosyltransferase
MVKVLMAETTGSQGISVVIPSWNGRALLEKFLPSVVQSCAAFESRCCLPTEILIADDASNDDTVDWLCEYFPMVRCESAAQRRGFAPTVNRGVQAAKFSWVYVLNNDVALELNTLHTLIWHFENPLVFGVTGQVYDFATGQLRGAGHYGQFQRGFLRVHERYYVRGFEASTAVPYPTLWGSGGSVLYDRNKFLAIGGFEELFAPFGWEDVEICVRAWKQGFVMHYEPQSAVWHQFSSTIRPRFDQRWVQAIYEPPFRGLKGSPSFVWMLNYSLISEIGGISFFR